MPAIGEAIELGRWERRRAAEIWLAAARRRYAPAHRLEIREVEQSPTLYKPRPVFAVVLIYLGGRP